MAADRHAIERAAAAWHARREAGLDPAGQAELRAWLAADPAHAAALARLDPRSSELDWPLYSGTLDEVLAGLEARAIRRRARRRTLLSSVAVAAVLLLASLLSFRWLTSKPESPGASVAVHTPRVLTLPDGSLVELKDDADIEIAFVFDARRIKLLRGTAHFTVRPDAQRPFLVTAGTVTARAVGTAFLFGIEHEHVALVVTEGRVALDHGTPAPHPVPTATLALVRAGESVAVDRADHAAPPRVTPLAAGEGELRLAWRTPRVTFNGTALRDVVATLNRHNREQLVLADDSLGSLRVSGTLRADRVDALIALLESDFGLAAERSGQRIVLRQAVGSAP